MPRPSSKKEAEYVDMGFIPSSEEKEIVGASEVPIIQVPSIVVPKGFYQIGPELYRKDN